MSVADGPRSLKDRQREERERLILEAAEELLAEKGYHEMSIDEIAARVGVSKGTVYLHFSSKEELVLAQLARHAAFRPVGGSSACLRGGADREAAVADGADLRSGLSGALTILHLGQENPDLRNRLMERKHEFHQQWESLTQRVSQVFDEGKSRGDLDVSIPTAVMASVFWRMLTPRTNEQLRKQMSIEEMVRQLSRLFFKGLAADGSQERNME